MSSIFVATQDALKAALLVAPALAGGNIGTNRNRPIPDGQTEAIVIRLDLSDGEEAGVGSRMFDWKTTYVIECYARAATGTDPATAVDQLLIDTWQRLASLSSDVLGADISLSPRIDWQYDDVATPVVCAVLRLTANHNRTQQNSLEPQ